MAGTRAVEEVDLASAYFERLRERFEAAAEAVGGAATLDLEMAGLPLRVRCAGEPLRRALLGPFEHLASAAGGEPALSVSVFDTAGSGVDPPPPLWEPLDAAPGTNPAARLRSDRACVLAAAGSRALTAAKPAAGEAVFHLPDGGAVPASERAAPIREALQLLMSARGRSLVHAAAVGRGGRGALLVGRGGSGKSTLALACALAGMEIAGDDYVLLEPRAPAAYAMHSTAKLTAESAARLGVPAAAIDPAGFEPTLEGTPKALVEIRALAPGRMTRRLELGALVAPSIGARTELRRVSGAAGLRAVAPSTIVQSGFAGGSALAHLAELARRVPSHALELGPDPAANAAAVERVVAELG